MNEVQVAVMAVMALGGLTIVRLVLEQHGGSVRTWASKSLAASVRGGGGVRYKGSPTLATSVKGGGGVNAESE